MMQPVVICKHKKGWKEVVELVPPKRLQQIEDRVERQLSRWPGAGNIDHMAGYKNGPWYRLRLGRDRVAFRVTKDDQAVSFQNALICDMNPRDNDLKPGCDDTPF